jgi:hypothetical protein
VIEIQSDSRQTDDLAGRRSASRHQHCPIVLIEKDHAVAHPDGEPHSLQKRLLDDPVSS